MCGSSVGERDVGAVAAGAVAGRAGGHQDRAGQHGGRFEQQLVARAGGRDCVSHAVRAVGERIDAREQRIERDLLQHEAAVVAAVVDVVQVPLAEVVVGPLAGRVVEVVGPRIERQLVDAAADRTRPAGGSPDRSRRGLSSARSISSSYVPAGDADVVDVQRNRAARARGRTAPCAVRIRARRRAGSRCNR